MKKYFVCAFIIALALTGFTHAAELSGSKAVTLHGNSGEKMIIGSVRFTPAGDNTKAEFTADPTLFGERFLAMRPFICLDGEKHSYCHFPYKSPQRIRDNDLTDLEYQLMFLRKPRSAVNIDAVNGLYYELKKTDKGFEGVLREVDMTPIIVPEGDMTRPIKRANLFVSDPSGHWLPRLTIE